LAASFVVAAAGAGGWVWFVSWHTPADASTRAAVLGVFFGLLAIPAMVIALLTLKATRSGGQQSENKGPTATFSRNTIAGIRKSIYGRTVLTIGVSLATGRDQCLAGWAPGTGRKPRSGAINLSAIPILLLISGRLSASRGDPGSRRLGSLSWGRRAVADLHGIVNRERGFPILQCHRKDLEKTGAKSYHRDGLAGRVSAGGLRHRGERLVQRPDAY